MVIRFGKMPCTYCSSTRCGHEPGWSYVEASYGYFFHSVAIAGALRLAAKQAWYSRDDLVNDRSS